MKCSVLGIFVISELGAITSSTFLLNPLLAFVALKPHIIKAPLIGAETECAGTALHNVYVGLFVCGHIQKILIE